MRCVCVCVCVCMRVCACACVRVCACGVMEWESERVRCGVEYPRLEL